MKNININNVINSIIKIAIAILLIVGASTRQNYGFYNLLRCCVTGTYCYFAFQAYLKKYLGLVIYFVIVAILFNPLKKVWLGKELWHKVDYAVALITAITIVFDWWGEKNA